MPCNAVIEDFCAHARNVLELDEDYRISILEECASNMLFLISNGKKKYVLKKYLSTDFFNTESFFLLRCADLGLKIPSILYFEEKKQNGWNWILYEYIEGSSLYNLNKQLNKDELSCVFFEVAQELRKLHSIELSDVFVDPDRRKYVDKIIYTTEHNYSMLGERQGSIFFQRIIDFLRDHYYLLEVVENYSFIMRDFTDKHIILQKENDRWRFKGIIDFEMVHFSNKFYDFVLLYVVYLLDNRCLEESFLRGYAISIDDRERNLIAFFILQYALELCGILKDVYPGNEKKGELIILKVFSWLDEKH